MPGELEEALAQERARQLAAQQKREQARLRGEAIIAEFLAAMASKRNDVETVRTPVYVSRTERIGLFKTKQVNVQTGESVVEHDLAGWVLQQRQEQGKDSPGRPLVVLSRDGQLLNEGRAVSPDFSLVSPTFGSIRFESNEDRVQMSADGLYAIDLVMTLQRLLHTHGLQ